MIKFVIDEDVEIILDGNTYLLERGDVIIIEDGHWQVVGGHPGLKNNPALDKAAKKKAKKGSKGKKGSKARKQNLSFLIEPPRR